MSSRNSPASVESAEYHGLELEGIDVGADDDRESVDYNDRYDLHRIDVNNISDGSDDFAAVDAR